MKKYEAPVLEVEVFIVEDVVTASGDWEEPTPGGEGTVIG